MPLKNFILPLALASLTQLAVAQSTPPVEINVSSQTAQQINNVTADKFVQAMVSKVFAIVEHDSQVQQGDMQRINQIVEAEFMPYVDFRRITAATIGPQWRTATNKQKDQVVEEFKNVLIKTYASSINLIKDVKITIYPLRKNELNLENVTVKSQASSKDKKINIDYRLRKNQNTWLVYDVNIAGVWFIETYRQQFTPIINKSGLDGLIQELKNIKIKSAKTK